MNSIFGLLKVNNFLWFIKLFARAILPLLFSGCMANLANSIGIDTDNLAKQDKMFVFGDYKQAAEIAVKNKNKKAIPDEANLLSTLQAGNSYLFAKDYSNSLKMFDESEAIIKYHHEKTLAGTTTDYIASLMLNDAAVNYHASIAEAIMVNTYKSLNFMALGKFEQARVELNRALERERRAKETYAELIAKQKDAIAQKKREKQSRGFEQTLNNPQIKNMARQNYSSLNKFEAYPDFVNPFTTYLAGLFFLIEGDYAKSSSLLKEVHEMMPDNETVKSDFIMVEETFAGKAIQDRYVWVIYENGLGPVKSEFKINIPMYIVSNKVIYTGIALPKMEPRSQTASKMIIFCAGKSVGETSVVGDMERVVLSEFNYSYNDILTRAVFSTILKTYSQYEAQNKNPYFGLASAAFQLLTTHADTRLWSTLPKDFQVAKVKMPEYGKLVLKTETQNINVDLDLNAKHSIVYVRIPTAMSKPSVSVMNF